jgi:hypothetical protein
MEWLETGDGPREAPRGFAEAGVLAAGDFLGQQADNIDEPPVSFDDPAARRFLAQRIDRLGGVAVVAGKSGIAPELLDAFLAGSRVPHAVFRAAIGLADAPAPAETAAKPAKTAPSVWQNLDFEALVMCLELNEDLDKLGGGQLKSARSRLRRALNAYDLAKHDKD